ncbi:hypothetical protein [Mastigocoleus testarum]|uniref:Uncharacterized protein n=1 Tax=Mastigocoleus testarum BC008 TaxID=371196 RepID=A0A0V7ZVE9_9CYAN|nr:hypothetical protein [Mastigocoleus testarum]KST68488.1 hypothetical protein BC008_01060 [Mastigocoleus testarum BC008]
MLKKAYIFSLLAASLILMPTVAFAEQEVIQEINQSGTASDNSRVRLRGYQRSTQRQSRKGRRCASDRQDQFSRQRINQRGVAEDDSTVEQNARQISDQRQKIRRGRFDRCD